ncbi:MULTISPECIES: ABC transporter permease [Bacillaceae]|uniref:ABC transporter permease n=1 Tax=Anoxybacillaceae TaxID=3120669 RepID=UPI001E2B3046|nr:MULTISPECIES: ABC transporter permease [Bacillaceae]
MGKKVSLLNQINNTSLFIIWLFILVPVFISYRQSLKLEKEIIWSALRGFIQLLILGFCISYLFSLEKWYAITLRLPSLLPLGWTESKKVCRFRRQLMKIFSI